MHKELWETLCRALCAALVGALIALCAAAAPPAAPADAPAASGTAASAAPTQDKEEIPVQTPANRSDPIVSRDAQTYSPARMEAELSALQARHPEEARLFTYDSSALGQPLYAMEIGNPEASTRVLVQAGMHGREWINVQILLAQIEDYLGEDMYDPLLERASFLFVPMTNPDGVRIAQEGAAWIENPADRALVERLIVQSGRSHRLWKANGRGVDLNRNFDAHWEDQRVIEGVEAPAYAHYPGPAPESEPETQALLALTEAYAPTLTLSYHSRGEILYWYFFQEGEALKRDARLAQRFLKLTGYAGLTLEDDLVVTSFGGYKDYCVETLGIPAFTVETGASEWGVPVPVEHFPEIYAQCKNLTALAAAP
ncbi:MAG: M14 family zinc carboxypeptidase [Candidatus Spyradocola sp.]